MSTSILRYDGAAMQPALETKRNRVPMLSTIRVAIAYGTISFEMVCVIAGMMLVCIVLNEDSECYKSRMQPGDGGSRKARAQYRAESMRKWQEEWESSTKGIWTG